MDQQSPRKEPHGEQELHLLHAVCDRVGVFIIFFSTPKIEMQMCYYSLFIMMIYRIS